MNAILNGSAWHRDNAGTWHQLRLVATVLGSSAVVTATEHAAGDIIMSTRYTATRDNPMDEYALTARLREDHITGIIWQR